MHIKRIKCTMILLGCLFTAFFLSACSNGQYTYEIEGREQARGMQIRPQRKHLRRQKRRQMPYLTGRRKQIPEKRSMSRSMVRSNIPVFTRCRTAHVFLMWWSLQAV